MEKGSKMIGRMPWISQESPKLYWKNATFKRKKWNFQKKYQKSSISNCTRFSRPKYHISRWKRAKKRAPFQGFMTFSFNLSSRIGPMIMETYKTMSKIYCSKYRLYMYFFDYICWSLIIKQDTYLKNFRFPAQWGVKHVATILVWEIQELVEWPTPSK